MGKQLSRYSDWYLDLCALTLLLMVLFGLFLGIRPLSTPDEARYAEIPREMWVYHDFVTPHLNGVKYFEKPPLFYWIQAASIGLFSSAMEESASESYRRLPTSSISEWIVRIPNTFLAVLGCLILYSAGRLLFDRRTGFLSSVILASSLLYFTLARMVTLDMCLTVCLSGSLLAFLVAVMHFPPGCWRRCLCYLAYALSALAVLTKGLVGVAFPLMIAGLWVWLTRQWMLIKESYLLSGLLIFLVIVLPWHGLVQYRNPEFFQFYFLTQQILRYATPIAQRCQPDWFFVPILAIGFLPWTAFLLQAIAAYFHESRLRVQEGRVALFLLLWIASIFIFFSFSHSKLIPYILPIFPALALLTGHYLAAHWTLRSSGVRWGLVALPVVCLVLGLLGMLWWMYWPTAYLPKSGVPFIVSGYCVLLLASIAAAWCYPGHGVRTAIALLVLGSGVSFIIFSAGIPHVDTRSIKPLTQVLKSLTGSRDQVMSYSQYYQDLPFYLNHRVIVVNVSGELSFGIQHQGTARWVLPMTRFKSLWNGPGRVFMITDQASYHLLQKQHEPVYWLAATPHHDVLLSNRPIHVTVPGR